nr:hypothetical protein [Tanacetum cinerariifolium]
MHQGNIISNMLIWHFQIPKGMWLLQQYKLVPITAVRPVNAAVPKPHVTRPRQAKTVVTKPNSPPRRHINPSPSLKASNFPPKVTTVKAPIVNGIKREFSVPRTPQQNGIAERKNRTLIEAARTMLADSLLPIPFWVEAVNTACKFDEKVDDGFLVGYSVSSKSFRVFNSRTRIVQETLHINFLENNPNVAGIGPTWLFDSDTLIKTMNYQPVTEGNQSNPSACVQEQFDAEKAGEENIQQYVLFPVWSSGSTNPQNTDGNAAFEVNEPEFERRKTQSEVHVSLSNKFEDFSDNSINEVNAADFPVPVVGVFKKDERGIVVRNKAQLVAQGHTQEEEIDYEEVFAPVARIEAINGKSASTPIDTEKPLLNDPNGEDVDVHTYRSMIGSLMYLTSSRPDIMFVVCAYARFQVTPKASNLHVVKRIFRYLKGKPHLGLWYPKDSPFNLVAYSDSDYVGASLGSLQPEDANSLDQADEGAAEINIDDVPAATITDDGDASVADDDVLAAVDKPSIPSPTPSNQPPPPSQDIHSTSQVQPTPPPSPIAQPPSPQQQPQPSQDADIFMYFLHNILDTCTTLTRRVENLEQDKIAQALEITKLKQRVKKLERRNKLKVSKLKRLKKVGTTQRVDTSNDNVMDDVSKQERIIASMDADVDVNPKDVAEIAKEVALDAEIKESDDELEPDELQEVVEVVTTAKLITEVVTAASATITDAAPILTTAAAPTLTTAPSTARRRKGVVIRDPEETATPSTIIHTKPKSKDRGKGIMVHEPKPLKKKTQIEQDEAYARELEAELNKNIDWDKVIDQVKRNEKEENVVMRIKEQMEEEDSRALKRKSESQKDKAAKKQKSDEEVKELRKHLQIVPNDDDDVYTKATPLALKRNQRSVHGLANAKSWKLLESCGVQIITFTTTQLILLVERNYPLTRFTLEQMLNNVRLEVEEESEVSLELLSFIRQQHQEGFRLE